MTNCSCLVAQRRESSSCAEQSCSLTCLNFELIWGLCHTARRFQRQFNKVCPLWKLSKTSWLQEILRIWLSDNFGCNNRRYWGTFLFITGTSHQVCKCWIIQSSLDLIKVFCVFGFSARIFLIFRHACRLPTGIL